jgi:hypothetical protein
MATTIDIQSGGFTTELFSSKTNIKLDKQGSYTDIVNRKYEGEIKKEGDRVTFYGVGNLTAVDYNYKNPEAINYPNPEGDKQTLIVDQVKIIPFKVGDIQNIFSNLDLVEQYTDRIAVAGGEVKDTYLHGLAKTGAATKMNSGAAVTITEDNSWAELCKMAASLRRKNAIKSSGLDYSGNRPALVVTPEYHGMLLQSKQFFANAFGEKVLRTGMVGRIGIFDVFVNTVNEAETGDQTIVALTSDAITYAEKFTKTETLRDISEVGDFVRCTMVYGAKVANPDCIVTNLIKLA